MKSKTKIKTKIFLQCIFYKYNLIEMLAQNVTVIVD